MSGLPWENPSRTAELLNGFRPFRAARPRAGDDRDAIRRAVTAYLAEHGILDVVFAGTEARRVGRTGGGEFAGPCPLCGGEDRCRAWPNPTSGTGRAWCRQCHATGDALAWATMLAGREPEVRGSTAKTLIESGHLAKITGGPALPRAIELDPTRNAPLRSPDESEAGHTAHPSPISSAKASATAGDRSVTP